jgi:hypothetical protein
MVQVPLKKNLFKKLSCKSRAIKNPYCNSAKYTFNTSNTYVAQKQLIKKLNFRHARFIVGINIKERFPYAVLSMRRNSYLHKLLYYWKYLKHAFYGRRGWVSKKALILTPY